MSNSEANVSDTLPSAWKMVPREGQPRERATGRQQELHERLVRQACDAWQEIERVFTPEEIDEMEREQYHRLNKESQ